MADPVGGGGVEGVATPVSESSRAVCLLEHTHQTAVECCFWSVPSEAKRVVDNPVPRPLPGRPGNRV